MMTRYLCFKQINATRSIRLLSIAMFWSLLVAVLGQAWAIPTNMEWLTKDIPNLAPHNWKPEMPMVPEGTTNVALGKSVTVSTNYIILGKASMATNGLKKQGYSEFLEVAPGLQWFQIDLAETQTIYAVAAWHYSCRLTIYYDVIIQVSDDPNFIKGVKTIYNNDFDNSAGFGKGTDYSIIEGRGQPVLAIPKHPVNGRYIRLYSNGNRINELNHMLEVEVYGHKASEFSKFEKKQYKQLSIQKPVFYNE